WAAIDGDGRPKPLYYALRHANAPRLLTLQPREERPVLIAVNDTDAAWLGTVRVERQTFDGAVKESVAVALHTAPRSVSHLDLPGALTTPDDPTREVLVATIDTMRLVQPFREDIELAYDEDGLTAHAHPVEGGYRVDVHATSLVRDLALLADRLAPDAEVDEMLVTLLAGESHSFHVRTTARLDPADLTRRPVLRTANDLSRSE
ncbi:glycoside hydrolase family 2 protein, partial [Streptomyces sp. NPDC004752]